MKFEEKLKEARKSAGMSQEILAEKLGVSRQAVTKWETGRGMPDIENMMIISKLFGISVDEFISKEKEAVYKHGYLYESKTKYDIDGKKRFDIKLGGVSELKVFGTDGEKVIVKLGSDTLKEINKDFKVKIDDIKERIDIDVNRQNHMREAVAKEELMIEVYLPNQYLYHAEFKVNCKQIIVTDLECDDIELDGKIGAITLNAVKGHVECDCNLDMDINISEFDGVLDINQVSATSKLNVPKDFAFRAMVKGIRTSVTYEENGSPTENFSDDNADNVIELNGIKSELVINKK